MSAIQQSLNFIFVLVVLLLQFVDEAVAELCSSGIRCELPKYCCGTTCCYDSYDKNDGGYRYNYRVSFWNLWYFWFIILFVLMSCFGGCGYYKQRQRYSQDPFGSSIAQVSRSFSRNPRRGRTLDRTPLPATHSYFGYSGPGAENNTQNALQPPPYSEVMSHPGLYPDNKSDPPPYPGAGYKINDDTMDTGHFTQPGQPGIYAPENSAIASTVVIMPPQVSEATPSVQPPPYSEHERSRSFEPTNQNS